VATAASAGHPPGVATASSRAWEVWRPALQHLRNALVPAKNLDRLIEYFGLLSELNDVRQIYSAQDFDVLHQKYQTHTISLYWQN
jgi:hypothetical protein